MLSQAVGCLHALCIKIYICNYMQDPPNSSIQQGRILDDSGRLGLKIVVIGCRMFTCTMHKNLHLEGQEILNLKMCGFNFRGNGSFRVVTFESFARTWQCYSLHTYCTLCTHHICSENNWKNGHVSYLLSVLDLVMCSNSVIVWLSFQGTVTLKPILCITCKIPTGKSIMEMLVWV